MTDKEKIQASEALVRWFESQMIELREAFQVMLIVMDGTLLEAVDVIQADKANALVAWFESQMIEPRESLQVMLIVMDRTLLEAIDVIQADKAKGRP